MGLDYYEKQIYKIFTNESDTWRFNELVRKIKEKEICSERIARERIKSLVNKQLLKRIEHSEQNVVYTIDYDLPSAMNQYHSVFKKQIKLIKNRIKTLKQSANKISEIDFATEILDLWNYIDHLIFKTSYLTAILQNNDISYDSELRKIQNELFNLPLSVKQKHGIHTYQTIDKIWHSKDSDFVNNLNK